MPVNSDATTGTSGALNPNAPPFPSLTMAPPTTTDIENIVRRIVQETITQNNTELVDEVITNTNNLSDLDKIPDIVKAIKEFDGKASEYTAWRKSVERIIDLYGNQRNTAKYFGILSVIRNKIVGHANIALESYNTPLNWTAIKNCLNTHYADKRDISTLDYQLMTLTQGNNTIEQFYQKVYNHFSLILNNISGLGLDKNVETTLITSYRNKTLDTFIRGLNGDLPRLLAIKEPQNLPEALYLCTKLANQNFRSNYANQRQTVLPVQQRNLVWQKNNTSNYARSFVPQLAHFGARSNPIQNPPVQSPEIHWQNHNFPQLAFQPMQNQGQNQQFSQIPYQAYTIQWQNPPVDSFGQRQFAPPRPMAPKPQPLPEPMDIERSIRSQTIDYAIRPRNQEISGKRPPTQQIYQQPKQTRYFHIINAEDNNTNTSDIDNAQNSADDEVTLQEYMDNYNRQDVDTNNDSYVDVSDIHFLE